MQLIVVSCLIAILASVSAECDVGKTVNDFDFNKFTGTWYYLYRLSDKQDDSVECPTDTYSDPTGNISILVTNEYDKGRRSEVIQNGFAYDWDNTGYSVKYDADLIWKGRFYILEVDYNRYFIGKLCSDSLDKVLIYVVFRRAHPDDATMTDMKKALNENDIDFNQLTDWNANRCRDLSIG